MMNETVISTIRGLTEVLESALILNKHKNYTTDNPIVNEIFGEDEEG